MNKRTDNKVRSRGFPPLARRDARVLVLGSLPGARSIREQRYYAHPQNAFWRIMREVYRLSGDYDELCEGLMANGVAVWDVLQSSVRPGSMDADIRLATAQANDFADFFARHPGIEKVYCNGKKAAQLYRRLVHTEDAALSAAVALPSTSPAYAAMAYEEKLAIWRAALPAVN